MIKNKLPKNIFFGIVGVAIPILYSIFLNTLIVREMWNTNALLAKDTKKQEWSVFTDLQSILLTLSLSKFTKESYIFAKQMNMHVLDWCYSLSK